MSKLLRAPRNGEDVEVSLPEVLRNIGVLIAGGHTVEIPAGRAGRRAASGRRAGGVGESAKRSHSAISQRSPKKRAAFTFQEKGSTKENESDDRQVVVHNAQEEQIDV